MNENQESEIESRLRNIEMRLIRFQTDPPAHTIGQMIKYGAWMAVGSIIVSSIISIPIWFFVTMILNNLN